MRPHEVSYNTKYVKAPFAYARVSKRFAKRLPQIRIFAILPNVNVTRSWAVLRIDPEVAVQAKVDIPKVTKLIYADYLRLCAEIWAGRWWLRDRDGLAARD